MKIAALGVLLSCGSGGAQPSTGNTQELQSPGPRALDGELPTPDHESPDERDAQFEYEAVPDALSPGARAATDFFRPGPHEVSASNWTLDLEDCELSYSRFESVGAPSGVWLILGHGFARSERRMRDLAEHVASWGVSVVTPRYCFSGPFRVDHERNAVHATLLSDVVRGPGEVVIHAGQSAGGLTAVLAANLDPAAVALLGLDLTDRDGRALAEAPDIGVSTLGLFGEPASCNARGNGVPVIGAVADAVALRVVGATHCDFEAPTNWVCFVFCGGASIERSFVVRALTAAFVAHEAGLDPSGAEWFRPGGEVLQWLESEGRVSVLD